ncbi:MAG: response regulator, partial [Sphingobacteriales bacterium]
MNPITNSSNKELPEFLSGGGDMGRMIRQLDWSATSLGPVENWPQSLRSAFSICLNSNFPIAIYWGPELNLLYNDAWSPIPGNKHPWALGRPAREVWPEIWEDIAPQFEKAFTGVPGGSKDALLPMKRHGYTEECYFDFTFTPVYGEGGKVEGVFNAVTETTYRIINERRNAFLKNLSLNIAGARSLAEVYRESIRFLGRYSKDISFALLFDVSSGRPSMVSSTIPAEELDRIIGRPFDLEEVLVKGHSVLIPDLKVHFTEVPHHIWPEEPREGYILPVRTLHDNVDAIMVLGLNARRGYDEEYRVFLEGIGGTLVTVMQNIKSLEEHKMKADALAEIDRAKTTFFSNISHEFRTPLTLLLSPLEEIMNDPETIPENRHRSEVAYRNGLRMQKLVNMLLEFSRLEAGRVQGKFAKVDIAILTRDLASNFRSAIEKAGMVLAFDITEVEEEIYVDTDMWEIIILNLVSNAFKYSREGEIRIQIRSHGKHVEVSVIDTGIGIPEKQLDKVFDRFHRVENTDGRSQEGTGIGLSLVRELVKMHGGAITVESEVGRGSAFIILLPTGRDHLPADKIIENRNAPEQISQAAAFVNEALKWLPEAEYKPEQVVIDAADMPLVLLCDDNADMRNYVRRLLAEHFRVVTARDGVEALLKAVEYRPDLILTDVMMPKLDGFGLLERIRQQQEIKNTPVIFLSARAGAEAKMEGLDAGADDYIVKPFSARELLVRIGNLIRMTQVRRETEQQFYQLFIQAPAIINVFRGKEMRYELYHPLNKEIFGERDFTGLTIREAIPELEGQGIFEMLDEVYEKGKTIHENERPVRFRDKNGQGIDRFFNFTYQPWYDQRGRIQGVLNYANEVTEMVESRLRLQEREQALSTLANAVPQLVWVADGSG